MLGDLTDKESAKTMLVAFPIILGATGMAFDVGYFAQIDLHFFTVFTLSEHLLFSIEALPFALIDCLCGLMILVFVWWLLEKAKKTFETSNRWLAVIPILLLLSASALSWVWQSLIIFWSAPRRVDR